MSGSITEGREYCKRCEKWMLYEADGTCPRCHKQLIHKSDSVIMAELEAKYGVL